MSRGRTPAYSVPGQARNPSPVAPDPSPVALMVRILGIDPGSQHTGYGLIDMDGNRAVHVTHGQVTTQAGDLSDKLRQIFRGVRADHP